MFGNKGLCMAFSLGDVIRIEIALRGSGGDEFRNVWDYELQGVIAPTVSAAHMAEAWWNHVKAPYRAIYGTSLGASFEKVRCKSLMSPTGDAGEFGIPVAEQTGTRTPPAGDVAPVFLATGVKLVVGTRATRPGAKRFNGMYEADFNLNNVSPTFMNLCGALCAAMLPNFVLGAPAAGAQLNPVVVRLSTIGTASVWQPWDSYIVNPLITSQVSRKLGRGI